MSEEPISITTEAKPKKRYRPLNPRERKFVREYVKTGSATKAAAAVYTNMKPNSQMAYGAQKLRKPAIREMIDLYIKDEEVAKVLREQLSATKLEKNFETGETEWTPDNNARLKAVDISLKVKGAYPAPGGFTADKQINFIVSKMEVNGDQRD